MRLDFIEKINKVNYFGEVDWSTVNTERFWFKNQPVITHMFNAFNLTVPEIERMNIKSVKLYKDKIQDPELLNRIEDFFQEEYAHSVQHTRFNEDLKRHDYPVDSILKCMRFGFRHLSKLFSKKSKIALSVCSEHCSLTIIKIWLENELMEPGVSPIYDLLLWHAYEEYSHRALLFDVYDAIGGGYFRRIMMMILFLSTIQLILSSIITTLIMNDLIHGRGIKFAHYKGALKFIWHNKSGLKYLGDFLKLNFKP